MRDFVEAGLDVTLHDPLVGAGGEQAHLGHRIVCPAVGTKPVAAREEVRLPDRLQHQLQGRLDHPVGDRGDPQAAQLAAWLGDHPFPHRQRGETAILQARPQLVEESLDTRCQLNGRRGTAVHPGGLGPLVPAYPIPGHQQEAGISDKVEQVVEPAMRIITGPTVQLGLDLQYPALRLAYGVGQFVGIHRRHPSWSPGIPGLRLRTCWPPSPCARLSRARTTTGPPSHPDVIGRRRTCPPSGRLPKGWGDTRMVPTFTTDSSKKGGARLYPGSFATATPQTFTVASPPDSTAGFGVEPCAGRRPCAAHRPVSVRFDTGTGLTGLPTAVPRVHLLLSLAGPGSSDSADPSRTLSGLLPPFRPSLRSGCPQLHCLAATRQRWGPFTPTRIRGASRRTWKRQ